MLDPDVVAGRGLQGLDQDVNWKGWIRTYPDVVDGRVGSDVNWKGIGSGVNWKGIGRVGTGRVCGRYVNWKGWI